MPIELMPQNQKAFEVVNYYMAGTKWNKNKLDGLYYAEYDQQKLAAVMNQLQINDPNVYRKVSNCLFNLARLPQE